MLRKLPLGSCPGLFQDPDRQIRLARIPLTHTLLPPHLGQACSQVTPFYGLGAINLALGHISMFMSSISHKPFLLRGPRSECKDKLGFKNPVIFHLLSPASWPPPPHPPTTHLVWEDWITNSQGPRWPFLFYGSLSKVSILDNLTKRIFWTLFSLFE